MTLVIIKSSQTVHLQEKKPWLRCRGVVEGGGRSAPVKDALLMIIGIMKIYM